MHFPEHSDIPDVHSLILASGHHVPTLAINGERPNRPAVDQRLDQGCLGVGRPQRYRAILMPSVKDGVVWILGEGGWAAKSSGQLSNGLTGRGIGVLEIAAHLLEIIRISDFQPGEKES